MVFKDSVWICNEKIHSDSWHNHHFVADDIHEKGQFVLRRRRRWVKGLRKLIDSNDKWCCQNGWVPGLQEPSKTVEIAEPSFDSEYCKLIAPEQERLFEKCTGCIARF